MFKGVGALMLILGFGIFQFIERFPEYAGPMPGLTAVETITGKISHIRDGDTVEINGHAVRFGSLDCAERGTPKGEIATDRLREIAASQTLTCHLNGRKSYDRSIGRCTISGEQDVAALMIERGYCSRYW